ncbi:hypothetical protein EIN_025330 [Entamoeba invadens IP1]|uniref:hypothetical protein n=1 Tax=Entamoeba invadens IP1 TaxID=370355 RepID=UPI0002C3EFE4|nr:hypothetical protein EIN_025330 [Entamoeba invadens IP1]ELP90724.1 hypothetical protein EIN_025330 [Entamoeba invadens IP1]|eukprot:XP_004257495.1 hypothetical protein EIN_025330 [Entamoeba invadens IP1]
MFFIALLYAVSKSQEIVYSDGKYNWELNDSAMLNIYEYTLSDNKKWFGADLQQYDTLKFNGNANTIDLDLFCLDMQTSAPYDYVMMKIRMLPTNYRGDDNVDSGLITKIYNNQTTCLKMNSKEFPTQCQSVVKYLSIQIYQQFSQKYTFYFNDVKFIKNPVAVEDSIYSSQFSEELNEVSGSLVAFVALFLFFLL